jgi:hypothetical protein
MIAARRIAAVLLGLAASACLLQQASQSEVLVCPDKQVFATKGVAEYMERRCGTLDCHGSPARPMRLYGQYGLRHPEETNWSGGFATTHREREDNYLAVCGVDPETASQDGGAAGQSLVVSKAQGVEGHKGGTIMTPGSSEDACLAGWFRGDPGVAKACAEAIKNLSPH